MAKAKLTVLDRSLPDPGEVQFNPASLHLAISNHADDQNSGSTAQQHVRSPSLALTVELVFDTADEGSTDAPRSVRERTRPVENLILAQPAAQPGKSAPPRVRFAWGDVVIDGFVTSVALDLELFSAEGTALRAKIALAIHGQDPREDANQTGAGANQAGDVRPPGKAGLGAVGGVGFGVQASLGLGLSASAGLSVGAGLSIDAGLDLHAQAGIALGGESAAEFAGRMGMDPAAWRSVATGQLEGTLSLSAGAEIGFDASVSASAGLGAAFGVQSAGQASPEASFGLTKPTAASSPGASGFSLAAAGGMSAALAAVDIVKSEGATASTLRAFDRPVLAPTRSGLAGARGLGSVPAATAAAIVSGTAQLVRPMAPEQARTPLKFQTAAFVSSARAAPAPASPRPDARAMTYGFGVPLRPRLQGSALATAPKAPKSCACTASCACVCASNRRSL